MTGMRRSNGPGRLLVAEIADALGALIAPEEQTWTQRFSSLWPVMLASACPNANPVLSGLAPSKTTGGAFGYVGAPHRHQRAALLASAQHRAGSVRVRKGTVSPFINPYTFVSLPSGLQRGRPTGHSHSRLRSDCLSGSLTVRMTARTPLLLGAVQGDGGTQPPRRSDGRVFIPGSGLHFRPHS